MLLTSLEWKGEDRSGKRERGKVDQGLCDVPEAGKPGIDRAKVGATEVRGGKAGSPLHVHPLDVV